jgi:tetratricopeptide (TPR) repeat protein
MPNRSTRFADYVIACIMCLALVQPAAAGTRSAHEQQQRAQRASSELKAALSLQVPDPREVRAFILEGRFTEFEALSTAYEEKFRSDPRYEAALQKLYNALDSDDERMMRSLNTWVSTRRSHMSLGARGIFKTSFGYRARGTDYSRNTPEAQMQRMAQLHQEAISDLLAALKENARFTPAYVAVIRINRARGDTRSAERALHEATRWVPETYYVRHAYLRALEPKWGGDYSLMQAYVATLDEAAKVNPRIWSLKAEVPAALGDSAWHSKDYAQAIRYYTEALRFGDRLEFLKSRGKLFWTTREYGRAKADFAKYLEYNDSDAEVRGYAKSLEAVQ